MSSTLSIRLSGIERESIVDGEGIRYVVFVQGCPHHCPDCHNPQTHPFDGGYDLPVRDVLRELTEYRDYIDGLTLSGGEPFCQQDACAAIADMAHTLGLSVWCYTGYTYEYLRGMNADLLRHIDVLVDGRYEKEQRTLDTPFKGSRNQRILDIPASLRLRQAVVKDLGRV